MSDNARPVSISTLVEVQQDRIGQLERELMLERALNRDLITQQEVLGEDIASLREALDQFSADVSQTGVDEPDPADHPGN